MASGELTGEEEKKRKGERSKGEKRHLGITSSRIPLSIRLTRPFLQLASPYGVLHLSLFRDLHRRRVVESRAQLAFDISTSTYHTDFDLHSTQDVHTPHSHAKTSQLQAELMLVGNISNMETTQVSFKLLSANCRALFPIQPPCLG